MVDSAAAASPADRYTTNVSSTLARSSTNAPTVLHTASSIVVPLPLGHQRLADLVGAHRPSVTTALGELVRSGALSRREDGNWLLHGAPPEQLRHHKLVATLT
jgi:CRP-like cAMP-binding protein